MSGEGKLIDGLMVGDVNVQRHLSVTGGTKIDVVKVPDAATYTILAANSGKVHVMPDLTADCVLTMPAEEAGLNYKFIYGGATEDAQDWQFDTGADANYFVGGGTCIDDDDSAVAQVLSDGNSNSIMNVLTPTAGTYVEFFCDGTLWYVNGLVIGATATSITFADQS
jgi:hypothetical protein